MDAGSAKTCAPGGFARRVLEYFLQSPSKSVEMRSGSTRLAIVPGSHPLHDNDSGKDRVPPSSDTTALGVPSTKHIPLPPASGTEGGATDNLDSPDDGGADTTVALPQVKGAANKVPAAVCVCKLTAGGHRLRKRQREGSVFLSRATVQSLAALLCSVFTWDSLSLWRRELTMWASRYQASC